MKITRSSKIQSLILVPTLSIGLCFVSPVSAQTRIPQIHSYILDSNGQGLTELGTLGGVYSYASGINDAGQVARWFFTAAGARHAFITGPNGVGMTDLNSLVELPGGIVLSRTAGINDVGQIIAVATPLSLSLNSML